MGDSVAVVDDPEPDGGPAEALLHISTVQLPGAVVVTVRGEVDMTTAAQLADAIERAQRQPQPAVVIDLSAVTFFGSPGIAVLVTAETLARPAGQLLRVVVDQRRPVINPLIVTGFAGYLTLFHRLDDALAAAPDTDGEHITTDGDHAPDPP
jgi:anti-sigma B factor antagonist